MSNKISGYKIAGFIAALGCLSTSVSAAVIYTEDFNRADSNTVGNGWHETGDQANDVAIVDSTLMLRDNQAGVDAAIWQNLSTSGYSDVSLTFDWAASMNTESNDTLNVSWRDASSSWQTIWSTSLGGSDFATVLLDDIIGASDNDSFELSFWTNVSWYNEAAYLDNMILAGTLNTANVPEPATMGLFGMGLLGMGLSLKKKKASASQA